LRDEIQREGGKTGVVATVVLSMAGTPHTHRYIYNLLFYISEFLHTIVQLVPEVLYNTSAFHYQETR